jgi:hypothetical protein
MQREALQSAPSTVGWRPGSAKGSPESSGLSEVDHVVRCPVGLGLERRVQFVDFCQSRLLYKPIAFELLVHRHGTCAAEPERNDLGGAAVEA